MAEYVAPGYVSPGYVEGDDTLTLTFSGPADRRRAGTMLHAVGALQLPHITPRHPYGGEIIVALQTWHGLRIFGYKVISEALTASNLIGREATLLAADPVELGGGGSPGDILGLIGVARRPLTRAVFSNTGSADKYWSKLWAKEVILAMPMGLYTWPGEGFAAYPMYIGLAEHMELGKHTCTVEYGQA